MKYKVVSLFAGAGGLDLGFKNAGFEIVWANEFDKYASETYRLNFGDHLYEGDITNVPASKIPKADVLIGGFPCQPFSIAGYRKGFEDERGELFWQVIRVANKVKPSVIILENVRNLVSHDNGNTFKVIKDTLENKGYHVDHKILSSYEFGIPQTRQRIFIVAFKKESDLKKFKWPEHKKGKIDFKDSLESVSSVEGLSYAGTKYEKLLKEEGFDSVLQIRRHYIRANKKGMFPTLTANMGMGGHNVPIIYDNDHEVFRKITVREAFNVQGFPKRFKFPEKMAPSRLYKQAGNAVSVPVAKAVATQIMKVLNQNEIK